MNAPCFRELFAGRFFLGQSRKLKKLLKTYNLNTCTGQNENYNSEKMGIRKKPSDIYTILDKL